MANRQNRITHQKSAEVTTHDDTPHCPYTVKDAPCPNEAVNLVTMKSNGKDVLVNKCLTHTSKYDMVIDGPGARDA